MSQEVELDRDCRGCRTYLASLSETVLLGKKGERSNLEPGMRSDVEEEIRCRDLG